jgi:hypothetical protein
MSSQTKRRSCCGMRAPTRTRLSALSSLLPCSIRQTRSRDPHARVKKGIPTCAPMVETPVVFLVGLAASQSGAALPLAEPQHRNSLRFANFRDGQPQHDPQQKPQPRRWCNTAAERRKRRRVGGITSDAAPRFSPARPARFNLICVLGHQGVTRAGPAVQRRLVRAIPLAVDANVARQGKFRRERGRKSSARGGHPGAALHTGLGPLGGTAKPAPMLRTASQRNVPLVPYLSTRRVTARPGPVSR